MNPLPFAKHFPHISHLNGFSLVWTLVWLSLWKFVRNSCHNGHICRLYAYYASLSHLIFLFLIICDIPHTALLFFFIIVNPCMFPTRWTPFKLISTFITFAAFFSFKSQISHFKEILSSVSSFKKRFSNIITLQCDFSMNFSEMHFQLRLYDFKTFSHKYHIYWEKQKFWCQFWRWWRWWLWNSRLILRLLCKHLKEWIFHLYFW